MGTDDTPLAASKTVKYLALEPAMSATATAEGVDWNRSRLTKRLRCDRSTQSRMRSEFFFRVTTMHGRAPV